MKRKARLVLFVLGGHIDDPLLRAEKPRLDKAFLATLEKGGGGTAGFLIGDSCVMNERRRRLQWLGQLLFAPGRVSRQRTMWSNRMIPVQICIPLICTFLVSVGIFFAAL